MKIWVLNGPNLQLLGLREPEIYGHKTYQDLCETVKQYAAPRGVELEIFQSNHEGDLVDWIAAAAQNGVDGLVLNPAAYTHTSVALLDAVKAVQIPTVEVHLSDPDSREDFRKISYVRAACVQTVVGKGFGSYTDAIDILLEGN